MVGYFSMGKVRKGLMAAVKGISVLIESELKEKGVLTFLQKFFQGEYRTLIQGECCA